MARLRLDLPAPVRPTSPTCAVQQCGCGRGQQAHLPSETGQAGEGGQRAEQTEGVAQDLLHQYEGQQVRLAVLVQELRHHHSAAVTKAGGASAKLSNPLLCTPIY